MEILREIYWEAKRAPEEELEDIRNPYKRERLIKKFYGKTKEERVQTKAMLKENKQQRILELEAEEMGLKQKIEEEAKEKQRVIDETDPIKLKRMQKREQTRRRLH